jgi:hypothetical protein
VHAPHDDPHADYRKDREDEKEELKIGGNQGVRE